MIIMKPISDFYELVQVHKSTKGQVEVIIRNKNKYEAFGGILKEYSNPKSVYPTDLTLEMAQKEKDSCIGETLYYNVGRMFGGRNQ